MARPARLRTGLGPLDWILLACLALAAFLVARHASTNLNYNFNLSILPQYFLYVDDSGWHSGLLLRGLVTTIRLSLWSGVLATALGLFMGLCRVSPRPLWRMLGAGYVELVRNLPPLVLIFLAYFFFGSQLSSALGINGLAGSLSGLSAQLLGLLAGPPGQTGEFLSAVLALALLEGAYITEIVRAGIEAVDAGQWEAACALGYGRSQLMRHVILPQALRPMLPALAGQYISTIKDSAIVSVISVAELTFQAMELSAGTYRTFEIWITVFALYFGLSFICSHFVRRMEARGHQVHGVRAAGL